jgi:PEP-CTERM motif
VCRSRSGLSAACLVALCLAPAAVSADPIVVTITGGSADFERGSPGVVDLSGTEGFSITTRVSPFATSLGDLLPGETGQVLIDAVGLDLAVASATFRGVTYTSDDFEGGIPRAGAELIFRSGPFVAPPISPVSVSLQTPFTFRGSFFDRSADGFTARLQGRGTMTADLSPVLSGDSSFWFFRHAHFDFANAVAPTPEPASIVLLGGAVAGLLAARRRNK